MSQMFFGHWLIPPQTDTLLSLTSVASANLPTWDDTTGTIYINDGNGNRRAIAWSPTGYVVSTNGAVGEYDKYSTDPNSLPDPAHSATTSYYFADDGNDGGAGTEGDPWQTIAKAETLTFGAGVEILFKRGDTWSSTGSLFTTTFTPSGSGTAGNYAKIGAWGTGAAPILNGNGATGSGGMGCILDSINNDYLWIDGIDFANGDISSGQVRIRDSSAFPYISNCIVRDGINWGLFIEVDNYIVKSCQFLDNFRWGFRARRDQGSTPTHSKLAYCTFNGNALGDDGATGSESCTGFVHDDEVYGCSFLTQLNTDHFVYRGWSEADETGNFVRFHDNTFDQQGATTFSGRVLGAKGHGLRAYRTKFYLGSPVGVMQELATGTDPKNTNYTHHNLFVQSTSGDVSNGAVTSTNLGNTGFDTNGYGELRAFNNTFHECYQASVSGDDFMQNYASNVFELKNNLFFECSEYMIKVEVDGGEGAPGTWTSDYNYFGSPDSTNFFYTTDGGAMSLATWQAITGASASLDANSTSAGDPLFVSDGDTEWSDRDYGLQSGSAARSVGSDTVPLVATDTAAWVGLNYVPHATTPDAGAYQYLSGKTLAFSKYMLGLACNGGTATAFILEATAKTESELNAWTGA